MKAPTVFEQLKAMLKDDRMPNVEYCNPHDVRFFVGPFKNRRHKRFRYCNQFVAALTHKHIIYFVVIHENDPCTINIDDIDIGWSLADNYSKK